MLAACRDIIELLIRDGEKGTVNLDSVKREVCKKHNLKTMPSNSQILSYAKPDELPMLKNILRKKPTRSLSGVSVVAVMTSPSKCPHGRCIYCPGGPELGSPQSYTGREPAALRGAQNDFDPYLQVTNRINQLKAIGHPVNKVELIIMGGTFPARDWNYQKNFIRNCLNAITGKQADSLNIAKKYAEASKIRNIGITIETRPDYCKQAHIDKMLELGATRVEIGVQALSDEIYAFIERGHTIQDVIEATQLAKDSGLKICYHMMPGLPGMDLDEDFRVFQRLFTESKFKPDMLKIYPCLVLENTRLYDLWKKDEYKPYSTEQLIKLLIKVMRIIPPWVRIQRIQRDIPAYLITAGNRKSDLRDIIMNEMDKKGLKTREIRYREVGHQLERYNRVPSIEDIKLKLQSYNASEGEEIFLSYEDLKKDILIGFLRLRIPSDKANRKELKNKRTALIRELHIFGPELKVGEKPEFQWQHRGYGKLLVKEAELISKEIYNCEQILITSGIGARQYYMKLGYRHHGVYMGKTLN
ncbi:MAG: tRNA uridine(34) 5-carboxymethylaminomethyl modification radical SAM/GNAT enzyme Elp3 [Candidatus Odinarchaeia archaeon]